MAEEIEISGRVVHRNAKGFINPQIVHGIALSVITICILIGVATSIMAIWEYADRDSMLRTVGTVAVIVCGTVLFTGVNRSFGE